VLNQTTTDRMHLPKHPQDANEFKTIFKGQRSTNPSSTNRNLNQSRKFVQTAGDKVLGTTRKNTTQREVSNLEHYCKKKR